MTSVAELLQQAARRLPASDSPRLDVELLLCHVLGVARTWLIAHADDPVAAGDCRRFHDLLLQRQQGRPIAYLQGQREFWSLPLRVSEASLIPRPESEHLVEAALHTIPAEQDCEVADLGTGCGAIALAIATERPRTQVTAIDCSEAALQLARENTDALGLSNVRLLHSDWFSALAGLRFHVVVSNPPYIASGDAHLQCGDVAHEPRSALVAGEDGLQDIRQICSVAAAHLHPAGWLILEHGHQQGDAVQALMSENGLYAVQTMPDLAGHDRITLGQSK